MYYKVVLKRKKCSPNQNNIHLEKVAASEKPGKVVFLGYFFLM